MIPRATKPSPVRDSFARSGSRKVRNASSLPTIQPMATPTPIFQATSSSSQPANQPSACPAATAATAMARLVNGKARPSLSPASEVSPKRTSSSSPVPGGPTWTSAARTGSVGASSAARSSAEAMGRPSPPQPSRAMAAMVKGMVMPSSRQVGAQERTPSGRSSFSPAPISATITTSSLARSVTLGKQQRQRPSSPAMP